MIKNLDSQSKVRCNSGKGPMATKIANMTPHEVTFMGDDGSVIATIPASGQVARVKVSRQQVGEIGGIPLYSTSYGEVEGLPNLDTDTIYLVSGLVLSALAGSRADVVAPGELVRDSEGRVIGCKGVTQ